MGNVEPKALVESLANTTSRHFTTHWSKAKTPEAKAKTPGITLAHIKPVILINTLANTLVQAESDTLRDTVGS